MKDFRPELLAPAGSYESILAAVRCGADGIYVGGKNFSARANAVNFSDEELKAAAEYCHTHGVKLYRAMNTVILDSEAEEFCREVRFSAETGIDGLIIQDIGAAYLAAMTVPNMPLHGSTQMTVHTPLGAIAAKNAGFCRIVPARELSLREIQAICRTGIETEVFVQGAQCMSLSGQCYMSALIGSRSANRGQCAQACRLPFCAGRKKNTDSYALSLKDMSLMSHIGRLTESGCASYKIEGRMKRPEYVAAAVTALRKAIDSGECPERDISRLEAVFSRSGFTDGYLTQSLGREMFGFRRKEDVTAAKSVLPELAALYKDEKRGADISFFLTVKENTPVSLSFSSEGISGAVTGGIPEKAVSRSLSPEDAEKQLSKLGGTRYKSADVQCEIDNGITIPAAELNRLRREAVSQCDRLMCEKNTPKYEISEYIPERSYCLSRNTDIAFRVMTSDPETLKASLEYAKSAIAPISVCGKLSEDSLIERTAVSLPDIVTDEEKLLRSLEALAQRGFTSFVCGNFTHLGVLSQLSGIKLIGGTGLNITNSYALKRFAELGISEAAASFELKAAQFSALDKVIPTGFYAYGRLPLMITRNCPVKAQSGCMKKNCGITDRTGRFFPVECDGGKYARVRNCTVLETSDKLNDFKGASFALLDVGNMPPEGAVSVIQRYIRREKPSGEFTRGLYYRGFAEADKERTVRR